LRNAVMVSAAAMDAPHNAVLKFLDGQRKGMYIQKRSAKHIWTTGDVAAAHKYKDKQSAHNALKKLQNAVAHLGTLEVEIIEKE